MPSVTPRQNRTAAQAAPCRRAPTKLAPSRNFVDNVSGFCVGNGVAAGAVIIDAIVWSAGRDLDALASLLEEHAPEEATPARQVGTAG
jgi:hypothetical protein